MSPDNVIRKEINDFDKIIKGDTSSYNLDEVIGEIKAYWIDLNNEILFPITFHEIRLTQKTEIGFLIEFNESGNYDSNNLKSGKWIFDIPQSSVGKCFVIPEKILEVWLKAYESSKKGLVARIAMNKKGEIYVYFQLMQIALEEDGTGGDNIKVGIKVP